MRLGLLLGDDGTGLEGLSSQASQASDAGLDSVWLSQIFGLDALTALAVVGREVPRLELGTAVVPTYPRHPAVLAAQALTTQAATHGRLTLGVGLSHQVVIESIFGYSFDHPLRHMREYLSILAPLVREGNAAFEGETVRWTGAIEVAGATPFPILLAALGPGMLRLAGEKADGTVTWMTGPATIASHVAPTITRSAADASRPSPRVVVSLPLCVTDDEPGARDRANEVYSVYGQLPSYRAMLDREGAAQPGDIAVVGDEAAVRGQIRQLGDNGATDFVAALYGGSRARARTMELLAALARE